ncbi:MAG TPA: nucleotide sugar dehydrogenase [Feifaniaceae bacterium]|nr:nucleotide sugar dehydrogenase [Feifaniaceae bacterium]
MQNLLSELLRHEEKLAVVGLGYVGLPLAHAFSKKLSVLGFDVNAQKIALCRSGKDPTRELGDDAISSSSILFTSDAEELKRAKFFTIAVPTPVNPDKTPDLCPLIRASETVGRALRPGSVVVYESTVYPGVTEDVCIPILERESGLVCGPDFKAGYSPERMNPGDKLHRLENTRRIVSGVDGEALQLIASVYELIIEAGVHLAPSIKVAEAAKVAENSQRDINIAFMNELAMVLDRMDVDTMDVLDAMNTKWNALGFSPGLVGGHCIGVDPYYFVYEAERLGYHSQIILSGRKVNDGMGKFLADTVIKNLVLANKQVRQAKVGVLGVAFKENCSDARNSRVMDMIAHLRDYGIEPAVSDPRVDAAEIEREYSVALVPLSEIRDMDCVVFAVAHEEFVRLSAEQIDRMFNGHPRGECIIIDVKSVLDKHALEEKGFCYWRL